MAFSMKRGDLDKSGREWTLALHGWPFEGFILSEGLRDKDRVES